MGKRRSPLPRDEGDLFAAEDERLRLTVAPLADRMRPQSLEAFFGQDKVVGRGTMLQKAIARDEVFSMIFWGPPGSGKTTLARIIAHQTKSEFIPLSGVFSTKDDLLKAVTQAEERWRGRQRRTILFVDEIHRWNKAQQDALLPYVERGTVTLIGATTENPSFEVIAALLSRCMVFVLDRLSEAEIDQVVAQALTAPRGYGAQRIELSSDARKMLNQLANGDARTALNILELCVKSTTPANGHRRIERETVLQAYQQPMLRYDKTGDEHYHVISAYIKSLRGSNADAALYWLGRMLEAGEDPLFIARRMIVFASEDIGLADPHALNIAVACRQACETVGMPECAINLSHVTVYLATCGKSNDTYVAYQRALADVRNSLNEPVPLHLRNAPTKLMQKLGYHAGYKYSHDYTKEAGAQEYLPRALQGRKYFRPGKNVKSRQ